MENVEIEVISRVTIKPSSTTPRHLRHYDLSFLDQILPPVYNPYVLFYPGDSDGGNELGRTDVSARLKSSLSEILTRYYPLAGRLRDNRIVDCNDEGVPFLEARVGCRLSSVVQDPDPVSLRKFVPFAQDAADDVNLGIQLNMFECGGIAIGICVSHKLADGSSAILFAKTWAAICRGEANVVSPEFVSATLFPPKDDLLGFDPRTGVTTKKNIICRRFVFGSSEIESMRASQSPPVSRIQALSAFIWSRFASSTQVFSRLDITHTLGHTVNLRTRFEPPLPEHSFGNLARSAVLFLQPDSNEGCSGLAARLRESIAGIDAAYLERLKDGTEHISYINRTSEMFRKGEIVTFNFSSLCRFPLYETDYGWGKPLWVGYPALSFKNLVSFIDTKSGDGIEAYINLTEDDMANFENDGELQAHISGNAPYKEANRHDLLAVQPNGAL